MKVIKLFSIILLLFFCSVIAVAEQYSVTAETLNVRQRASSRSEILFKLSKGDIVESNDHGKWMEIDYNGQKGYAYSKYLKKVDAESSSSYNDNSISWLPIIWMTLPLVIFIAILFWLHKYYRWSSLFAAIFISLIVIVIIPPMMKFLFGLFGYETTGKYVGWVITILLVCGAFGSNTRKEEEREKHANNTSTTDVDDYSPSYLDSEDYSHSSSEHHYNNDFNNDYEDRRREYEEERQRREDEYDNYERERQEREEAEKKRDQYDRYMREAEEAYRQYDYNKSEAEKALRNADINVRSAEDNERRGREYEDEICFREAQNDRDMAESFLRDARQYQKQAKSYYCDYERAKREAESYR